MNQAFEWVARAGVSASVLIVVTALAQAALRKRLSAGWRGALWLPVVLRLLLPVWPESSWSLFNAPAWWKARAAAPAQAEAFPSFQPGTLGPGVATAFDVPEPAGAAHETISAAPARPVKDYLALLWAAGAATLLARLAAGWAWLSWRLRPAQRTRELDPALAAAGAALGRPVPPVRVTPAVDSPALFGVLRPVLLVPPEFTERLQRREWEPVLRHEMAHLQRRDLWMNLALELAQALHWFNPLVWLAFRQIRLEREIACDELALRGAGPAEARAYGETILQLLQGLGARRSLPAVVGIAEERSLARRRLAELARPRTARRAWPALAALALLSVFGLTNAQTTERAQPPLSWEQRFSAVPIPEFRLEGKTLGGALRDLRARLPLEFRDVRFSYRCFTNLTGGEGVFSVNATGFIDTSLDNLTNAFSALPLELAIVRGGPVLQILDSIASGAPKPLTIELTHGKVTLVEDERLARPAAGRSVAALVNDARLLLELGKLDEAEKKLTAARELDPENREAERAFIQVRERLNHEKETERERPKLAPNSGRRAIVKKLSDIIFEQWGVPGAVPLSEAIKNLSDEIRKRDPEKTGVNLLVSEMRQEPGWVTAERVPIKDYLVSLDPPLRNVRALDVLDAIARVAQAPRNEPQLRLKYSIEEYAVVFSLLVAEVEPLYTRTYKVDTAIFIPALERMTGGKAPLSPPQAVSPIAELPSGSGVAGVTRTNANPALASLVRNFFAAAGIDFSTNPAPGAAHSPPPQKAIFFNDRTGVLFVRATLRDLDVIENALQMLNIAPPQIHFDVTMLTLKSQDDFARFLQVLLSETGEYRRVLTAPEQRALLQKLEPDARFALVRLPGIVTLSGRPARSGKEGAASVDLVADVEREHRLRLRAAAFGHDAPEVKARSEAALFDGQTLIVNLPAKVPSPYSGTWPTVFFFVTPVIVDAAGNRVFTPGALPFDETKVPAQGQE